MIILLASLNYKPHQGGIENSFYYMANEFKALGHQVVIVVGDKTLTGKGRLPGYERIDEIEVFRFKRFQTKLSILKLFIDSIDIVKSYLLIRKLNSRFKFDLAVLRNESVGLGAVFALSNAQTFYILPAIRSKQDKKTIDEFSGNKIVRRLRYIVHEYLLLKQADFYQKYLINTASNSYVFSRNMKAQASLIAPRCYNNILFIKPGVDHSVFYPVNEKLQLRRDLNIPVDAFVFLIMARIIKVKGIDIAIDAIKKLNQSNVNLVVVGDGPETVELTYQSIRLGLKEKVLFFPGTKKPEDFYKAADAFVMSSIYEPFGQTILEAMASGLPVIGFRYDNDQVLTATEEIIEDGIHGFLCDFGVDPLAETMMRCTDLSAENYKQIQQNNREKMVSLFTWKNFCNVLLLEMQK